MVTSLAAFKYQFSVGNGFFRHEQVFFNTFIGIIIILMKKCFFCCSSKFEILNVFLLYKSGVFQRLPDAILLV